MESYVIGIIIGFIIALFIWMYLDFRFTMKVIKELKNSSKEQTQEKEEKSKIRQPSGPKYVYSKKVYYPKKKEE